MLRLSKLHPSPVVEHAADIPAPHEQILLHLDERGFVPFHPALAEKFGHKAAIFVGMALYWTRHSIRKHPQRGGWFNMSMQQWRTSIGLTRSEQESVREQLIQAGVLEENLIGRPAVMNYRINVMALATQLSIRGVGSAAMNWDTAQSWFRGCHSYYKPLADVVGNIAAGLYLSYLLQRYRDCLQRGQLDSGCIFAPQETIASMLHLGMKVQRNARERLKRAGLIQESGQGGALVRLNMDAILMCLKGQAIKPLKGRSTPPAAPVLDEQAATPARVPTVATSQALDLSQLGIAFRQLSLGLTNAVIETPAAKPSRPRDFLMSFLAVDAPVDFQQVGAQDVVRECSPLRSNKSKHDRDLLRSTALLATDAHAEEKFAVSCKLESAVSCNQELPKPAIYIQRDVFKTTTTLGSSGDEASFKTPPPAHSTSGLIMPSSLGEEHRVGVLEVLSKAPASDQQRLLDELDGQLRSHHKSIKSPAGWLYGLIRKMSQGPITLLYADEVASVRASQHEVMQASERTNPRFAQLKQAQDAQQLIQPGFVYRLDTTGALVYFDKATGVLRQKSGNDAWRVLLSGRDIVNAHNEGKLIQLPAEEGGALC